MWTGVLRWADWFSAPSRRFPAEQVFPPGASPFAPRSKKRFLGVLEAEFEGEEWALRDWFCSVNGSAVFSYMAYFLPAVISLIFFWKWKRNLAWISIPAVMAVDLLVWGKALGYNHGEFRDLVFLFLFPQLTLTAVAAAWICFHHQRRTIKEKEGKAAHGPLDGTGGKP